MHRAILTGVFAFSLSAGAFSVASADVTGNAATRTSVALNASAESSAGPVAADRTAGSVAADRTAAAAPAVRADADGSVDTAAPTAGADLVMWNAAPAVPETSTEPARPFSRLRRFASGIVNRSSAIASSLTRSAIRFIGVPYVFGGTRTSGFDCSGYVQHVFGLNGVHLPRTADAQFDAGRRIRAKMAPGDLVFFHTYAPGVSHVGIYLGNSKFIHASSSRGVAVSSLHDRYWAPRYLGAKRVVGS